MEEMASVKIAGIDVPTYNVAMGWIPETSIVLTPTTKKNLQKLLYPLIKGYNILLVGDAGVGKNALIYYVNQIRRHRTLRYSFNEDTLPEDLIGSYRIDRASHNFVWSDGTLAAALRCGATFVADEMNLSPPEVLKRFYSVFTDRYLQLLEGDLSILRASRGFNFIATQNPTESFEGRKNLPREIQKYFATVYIDPYPQDELVAILSQLNPQLNQELIKNMVKINQSVEEMLLERKIGSNDLESYHFNIRNLNRLAKRLGSPTAEPYNETYDLYLRPFRQRSDREKISASIDKMATVMQEMETGDRDAVPMHVNSATGEMHIGRARLQTAIKGGKKIRDSVQRAVKILPPLAANLRFLESVSVAISAGENILLECEANVEAEEYFLFFSELLGRPLAQITLSRGMHTSDILGGLKPSVNSGEQNASVEWVDGPLTAAVRRGDFILLKGLEAAGPELVEKLNMLLDDARALLLPPESGQVEPLHLKKDARIFAVKFFRDQRSIPTISRAFRNRFSAFIVPPLTEKKSLIELSAHLLNLNIQSPPAALDGLVEFHLQMIKRAVSREIGAARRQPYQYGLTNFRRMCEHIESAFSQMNISEPFSGDDPSAKSASSPKNTSSSKNASSSKNTSSSKDASSPKSASSSKSSSLSGGSSFSTGDAAADVGREGGLLSRQLYQAIQEGVEIAYINEISDPLDRKRSLTLLERSLAGLPVEDIFSSFQDRAKKKLRQTGYDKTDKISWDQKNYWRDVQTGRFKLRQQGGQLKKGLDINTPETGGNIKEGPNAWYGSDTKGNQGQGPPGAGGGAWGYRSEELYREFIKKRRPLWNYNIDVSLKEFKETFSREIEQVLIEFDHLFDPHVNIMRRYMSHGSRVDARRYLSYLAGKGDERLFDKTDVNIEEERLKGVEIVFLINKGRRIFNFEYSVATLVALMSSAMILADHKIPFSIAGYSDLTNSKETVNIVWYKRSTEDLDKTCEEKLFYGIAADWHGDTVEEAAVLREVAGSFMPDSRTRILTMLSDFRGHRAKVGLAHDLQSHEADEMRQAIGTISSRGILPLGVGVGARQIAEHLFNESLQIGGENFANLPSLLIGKVADLIRRHHNVAAY